MERLYEQKSPNFATKIRVLELLPKYGLFLQVLTTYAFIARLGLPQNRLKDDNLWLISCHLLHNATGLVFLFKVQSPLPKTGGFEQIFELAWL